MGATVMAQIQASVSGPFGVEDAARTTWCVSDLQSTSVARHLTMHCDIAGEQARMATLDNHWIWQRDYVIPSKSGAGLAVVEEILGQLQRQHWGERDRFGIHLAMEEALTNALEHGNRFDPQKHIQLSCRIARDLLRLEIADQGHGFDPANIPDPTRPEHLEIPCGRGIMLMRYFMSRVEFNPTGNRVILEKQRACSD